MKKILFIDIPTVPKNRSSIVEDIVSSKYKVQDIIYAHKGFNYAYQRKNQQFSRGFLTLGAYLKSHGFQAEYIHYKDANLPNKIKQLSSDDFVGVASITAFLDIVKNLLSNITKLNSAPKIVMGGYHSSTRIEETFTEFPGLDYIVVGEGEKPLLNLMKGIIDSDGICYRKNDKLIINSKKAYLPIEEIPNPDYSLLPGNLNDYNFNIQTARGCTNYCLFCVNSYFWRSMRFRPLSKVKEELIFLKNNLDKEKFIHFSDNIFTFNKERVIEICQFIIDNNINFQFSCDSKAQYLDEDIISIMAEAGFKRICLGFEDANDSILKNSHKLTTLDKNIEVAKLIKKLAPQIIIEAYWITGLPGSTHKSLLNNLNITKYLIEANIVDVIATSTVFTPLPGTPYFDEASKYGLVIRTKNWQDYRRANFIPIYESKELSAYELFGHFVLFESQLLKLYLDRFSINPNKIDSLHANALNTKVTDSKPLEIK